MMPTIERPRNIGLFLPQPAAKELAILGEYFVNGEKSVETHRRPDTDAIVSTWIMSRFLPGWQNANVQFVSHAADSAIPQTYRPFSVDNQSFAEAFNDVIEMRNGKPVIQVDTGYRPIDHHQPGAESQNISAASLAWEFVKAARNKVFADPIPEEQSRMIDALVAYTVDVDHLQHLFWNDFSQQDHQFSLYQVFDGLKNVIADDSFYMNTALRVLGGMLLSNGHQPHDINLFPVMNQWMYKNISGLFNSGRIENNPVSIDAILFMRKHLRDEDEYTPGRKHFSLKQALIGLQTVNLPETEFLQHEILQAHYVYLTEELLRASNFVAEAEQNPDNIFTTTQGRKGIIIPNTLSKAAEIEAYRKGYDIVIQSVPAQKGQYTRVYARPVNKRNIGEEGISLFEVHKTLIAEDPAMSMVGTGQSNDMVWYINKKGTLLCNDNVTRQDRIPSQLLIQRIAEIVGSNA